VVPPDAAPVPPALVPPVFEPVPPALEPLPACALPPDAEPPDAEPPDVEPALELPALEPPLLELPPAPGPLPLPKPEPPQQTARNASPIARLRARMIRYFTPLAKAPQPRSVRRDFTHFAGVRSAASRSVALAPR
jgi:hypothetical protein